MVLGRAWTAADALERLDERVDPEDALVGRKIRERVRAEDEAWTAGAWDSDDWIKGWGADECWITRGRDLRRLERGSLGDLIAEG